MQNTFKILFTIFDRVLLARLSFVNQSTTTRWVVQLHAPSDSRSLALLTGRSKSTGQPSSTSEAIFNDQFITNLLPSLTATKSAFGNVTGNSIMVAPCSLTGRVGFFASPCS